MNPKFGPYRVAVYAELGRRLHGQFRVICSRGGLDDETRTLVERHLGPSAISLEGERRVRVPLRRRGLAGYANDSLQVAYQPGLLRALRAQRPEVVIAEGFFQWTPAAVFWRQRSNGALVLAYERTAHTERGAGFFRTLYRRMAARWVDSVCCNGRLSREYCCNELNIPASRIVVGAMAADVEYLRANMGDARAAREALTGAPRPRFIFVGRLAAAKGVDTLMAAWARHEKSTPLDRRGSLHFVGSGPARAGLVACAARDALESVHFVGQVPHRSMGAIYSVADVLVLPTLEDNWSLVVPEAMAFKDAVITTTANGCWPELVKAGETGWLTEPGDGEALTSLLNWCSENPDALVKMGVNGEELVRRHTPVTVAEAFLRAIDLALENRGASC